MATEIRRHRGSRRSRPAGEAPRFAAFRRLLVPLDGSALAEAALPAASRLAEACGAAIVLLHVIERGAPAQVHGQPHLKAGDEAQAYLGRVAEGLRASGRTVETHTHDVPVGDVAASIASHAEEHAIDLTVLCTHGAGGLRDALWGSIAQQVVQHTTRPVLLERALSASAAEAFANPATMTIMVPLDGTAAAEAALPYAESLADRLEAQLRLILVVPTVDTVPADQKATALYMPNATRLVLDVQERQAADYLRALAAARPAAVRPALVEVRRGDAATQLATDAAEHADGLVVIATHGRAGLQAIWNQSVAARLLHRTVAPVLLVPLVE